MISDSYSKLQEKLIFSSWEEIINGTISHCSLLIHLSNYKIINPVIDKLVKNNRLSSDSFHSIHLNSVPVFPCSPFLEMIKEKLSQKTNNEIEQFLEKCKLYAYHKKTFLSFFCDKKGSRSDELYQEELLYERRKLFCTVKNMFYSLFDGKQLIVIYNAHLIGESTHHFIQYLNKNSQNKSLMILLISNKDTHLYYDEQRIDWNLFLTYLDKNNMIMLSDTQDNNSVDMTATEELTNDNFRLLLTEHNIISHIDIARLLLDWLAIREAALYAGELITWINNNSFNISDESFYTLYHIQGDCASLLDQNETALTAFNTILNHAHSRSNRFQLIEAYRKLAMVSFKKFNVEDTKFFINQCIKLADQEKNSNLLMKAWVTFHRIDRSSNYDGKTWKENFLQAVKYTEAEHAENTLAEISQVSRMGIFDFKETWHHLKRSINISRKNNNWFRVSGVYHCMGILYAHFKQHKRALKFYKKSEKIRRKIGTTFSLVQIYNGLGYYLFTLEQYAAAQKNYFKVLHHLYNMKNISELLLTFYNIGMCALFSMDHRGALIWFENMLIIMRKLNITTFPFHEREEIHSLLGICYYKTGRYTKAYEMYSSRQPYSINCDHESYISFVLLNALIAKKENHNSVADACFKELFTIIHKNYKNFYMYIPRIYFEYILFLKKSGNIEEFKEVLLDGITACGSLHFNFHKKLLISESEGEIFHFPSMPSSAKKFDFAILYDYIQHLVTINILHKKINEINLLNGLQSILVNNNQQSSLIHKSMNLISNSFLAELVCCSIYDDLSTNIGYISDAWQEHQSKIEELTTTLRIENRDMFETHYKWGGMTFSSLIFLPLKLEKREYGAILCCTVSDHALLSNDDFRILAIVARQMSTALHNIQLYTELEMKNNFKTIYLTNLSHEIKTPLNAIMGYNQNMMYGSFLVDSELQKLNEQIMESITKDTSSNNQPGHNELLTLVSDFDKFIFDKNRDLKMFYYYKMKSVIETMDNSPLKERLAATCEEAYQLLYEENESILNILTSSNRSAKVLLDMINSILDISRIESGKVSLSMEQINLYTFIDDIFNTARAYTISKNKDDAIELVKECSLPEDTIIIFDETKIKQVILNLMSNAIKFTKKGHITFTTEIVGRNISFSISDTGLGIKEDEMEILFQEFERTSSSTDVEGTGLGLAYSKKLVELHNGTISATSTYGTGSKFTVNIPLINKN